MTYEVATVDQAITLDRDLMEIKKTFDLLVHSVNALVVDNDTSFKIMTSYYRKVRDWKKLIEEKRKAATEPYRTQVALINDRAKELTDALNKIESITRLKADEYQRHLEELRRQEEERARAAAAILDIPEETVYIEPVSPTIRGDGAMAYTVTEKKFKVTDIAKVPAKYLKLDEVAVKQDLKLGIWEIPGLEIYEEKITKLRAR